ncbi:MAG: Mov34/MPN/PAD-1 family protein [Methanomicrobiales archaeon]|jgi:proteasome lid subunit RPN8/RPN11|nr:Mov34/MPN/PAD-1 family protein [Methanomicrobiales archaeon]
MEIRGIKGEILDLLMELGRESHPHEFVGLLCGNCGVIDEFNLLPGSEGREESATLLLDMIPLGLSPAGSVHSHPNGVLYPSDQDLSFFPRVGRCHLIVGAPYLQESWRAFRTDGRAYPLDVVG